MKVIVKLFAGARELAASEQLEVELTDGATVGSLRAQMLADCPALTALLPHAMFAINASYASDHAMIPADAEVACIPPVSGG